MPKSQTSYLLTTERLGLRNWKKTDLELFSQLNQDAQVMKHFPKPLTEKETSDFIDRLQKHYKTYGYCYFATEILESQEFIGFIGLAYQKYKTPFTPATDIGWRLKPSAWGKGYATEGAKRCLNYAFEDLQLPKIISTCTLRNHPSENVMRKIGMKKAGTFKHPNLKEYPAYEDCLWYEIKNPNL